MENPTHRFRKTNLELQLIYESQTKTKTVMSWSSRKKSKGIFVFFLPFILSEGIFFFNICVLFQCTVYWIHFQNIHTFTYQKTLFQNRRKPSNVSLMESNTFKGVSFITEVKLKALSWILLIKFFEQNIHKSRQ